MGQQIQLNTSRMQCIGAYVARAAGTPKGGLVIVQEIFGVTAHIRSVADRFAEHGYTAIAPAFFDHVESGLELGYDEAGSARGKQLVGEIGLDLAVEDVASAAEAIASAGRIGCVGYCWGGTVAFLAALRLGLPAVSYYGARNAKFLDETPRAGYRQTTHADPSTDASPAQAAPWRGQILQFHFGERDGSIPAEVVAQHRARLPAAEVYTYPAGHAFNRDVDPKVYDAASANLALTRTLGFFDRHLAGAAA